MPGRPPQIWLD